MVVGLLAAVGAAMSALVGVSHADVLTVMIMGAGAATGLAAFLALPPSKKILFFLPAGNSHTPG
jgi:sarcosine oxidase gamma subunit